MAYGATAYGVESDVATIEWVEGAAGGLHTSHPEYNEITLAQTGAVLDDSKDWSSMLFPLVDELPARHVT